MILAVDADEGRALFAGAELPAVLQGISVSQEAQTDDRQRPNRSGVSKRPKGFGDAEVRMQLAFIGSETATPHQQLAEVAALFSTLDSRGQPQPITLIHPHVQAHGFALVYFLKLTTTGRNDSRMLTANLEFCQFRPIPKVAKKEALKAFSKLLWAAELKYNYYVWQGGQQLGRAFDATGERIKQIIAEDFAPAKPDTTAQYSAPALTDELVIKRFGGLRKSNSGPSMPFEDADP